MSKEECPPKEESKLSSKVTSMRFMQRAADSDTQKKKSTLVSHAVRDEDGRQSKVIVADGEGDPFIRLCPGRRSFGKFNEHMQEYAAEVIKDFKKIVREAEGKARGEWKGLQGQAPKVGVQQEGKDMSDREMASVLGKRELGQSAEQIVSKAKGAGGGKKAKA